MKITLSPTINTVYIFTEITIPYHDVARIVINKDAAGNVRIFKQWSYSGTFDQSQEISISDLAALGIVLEI